MIGIKSIIKFFLQEPVRNNLYSTHYTNSVIDFDFNVFDDVALLIFDLDDTIIFHQGRLSTEYLDFLKNLSKKYKLAFLSNTPLQRKQMIREQIINNNIEIYIEETDEKPDPMGFLAVCKFYNIDAQHVAMIGDRVGSDIYGAQTVGIKYRLLTKPLSYLYNKNHAPWHYRLLRYIENFKEYRLIFSSNNEARQK